MQSLPALVAKPSHHNTRKHEQRQCSKCITSTTVNAACALLRMRKTFETNLTRIGLPVPVADGCMRTAPKTA